MDSEIASFNFTTTLFPKWYFPYRPIFIHATKQRTTRDSYLTGSNEVDSTGFGVRWGLSNESLGKVRMSYQGRLTESIADQDQLDGDNQRHEFEVDALKVFRKAQWGESDVKYGYEFDYTDDTSDYTSNNITFMQHYLYARNNTQLGEKTRLSAETSFFQRSTDTNRLNRTSNFFSVSSDLSIRQTDYFRHSYALGMSRTDSSTGSVNTNYHGSVDFNYRDKHKLNKYWSTFFGTGLDSSFSKASETSMNTRGIGKTHGNLIYGRRRGNFAINGNYSLNLSQPIWMSQEGGNSTQGLIAQSVQIGYNRLNNPLYTDTASASAYHSMSDEVSQRYNLNYLVTSVLSPKDRLRGTAKYRMNVPDSGDKSSNASLRGRWVHQIGRGEYAELTGQYALSMSELGNATWMSLYGRYKAYLIRRFNLRFSGGLGWQQRTGGHITDESTITGTAGLLYNIGRFSSTLYYRYSTTDKEDDPFTDQSIRFEIKRNFTLGL